MALQTHGITQETPKNLMLGAGTFHKNLKSNPDLITPENPQGWTSEILGTTSGGGSLNITPEYYKPDVDGATVAIKGLVFKVGEEATMGANVAEFSPKLFVDTLHLREDTGNSVPGYKKFVSTPRIGEEDFLDNVAFVGTLTSGEQIIVIFNNAICTGAMELSPENSTISTYEITFECTATFEQLSLDYLPYEIYYPERATNTDPEI